MQTSLFRAHAKSIPVKGRCSIHGPSLPQRRSVRVLVAQSSPVSEPQKAESPTVAAPVEKAQQVQNQEVTPQEISLPAPAQIRNPKKLKRRSILKKPKKPQDGPKIRRERVIGWRRFSSYAIFSMVFFGSLKFIQFGFFSGDEFAQFQATTMAFYAVCGQIFSVWVAGRMLFNIDEGFNEYNRETRTVRIFRWGWPGKSRRQDDRYAFEDVSYVILGNPSKGIIMKLKGRKEVTLTSPRLLMTIQEHEMRGAQIAKFIGTSIRWQK